MEEDRQKFIGHRLGNTILKDFFKFKLDFISIIAVLVLKTFTTPNKEDSILVSQSKQESVVSFERRRSNNRHA